MYDFEEVINAITKIKEKHGKKKPKEFIKSSMECPVCKGILHYSISNYNNHIWGKCETEGCLNWMM
jgi:C4-type Zn-finger protein